MIIVLRMPRTQPTGATMSSDSAGSSEWVKASWMKAPLNPGVAAEYPPDVGRTPSV